MLPLCWWVVIYVSTTGLQHLLSCHVAWGTSTSLAENIPTYLQLCFCTTLYINLFPSFVLIVLLKLNHCFQTVNKMNPVNPQFYFFMFKSEMKNNLTIQSLKRSDITLQLSQMPYFYLVSFACFSVSKLIYGSKKRGQFLQTR